MEGISGISIAISLVVILVFLTFSQDRHDIDTYRDRYIFLEENGTTSHFKLSLSSPIALSDEFPLRIRASNSIEL